MGTRASRRKLATEETRRLILAAARELYTERGFKDVPVRELAAKAGVAEGTIFAHFPDKASLLAAAVLSEVNSALAGIFAALPEDVSCRVKLLYIARSLYAFYGQRPDLWRAYIKETLFLAGEWGLHIAASVEQFIGYVGSLIETEKEAGKYDPGVDSKTAARTYFAAYFFELLAGLNAPEFNLETMCANLTRFIDQWEAGLLAQRHK